MERAWRFWDRGSDVAKRAKRTAIGSIMGKMGARNDTAMGSTMGKKGARNNGGQEGRTLSSARAQRS